MSQVPIEDQSWEDIEKPSDVITSRQGEVWHIQCKGRYYTVRNDPNKWGIIVKETTEHSVIDDLPKKSIPDISHKPYLFADTPVEEIIRR